MVALAKPNFAATLIHKPGLSIKAVPRGNGLIEGHLVAWGDPQDSDLEGQWFTKHTDLRLDWFQGDLPVLYHHGMDQMVGLDPIGRIKSVDKNDLGLWVQAQLNLADRYGREVSDMIQTKRFGWSSGSVDHLVKIAPDGEIVTWPIFEGSITPTPAQPHKTTVRAFKSLLDESDPVYIFLGGLRARAGAKTADATQKSLSQGEEIMSLARTKRFVRSTLKRNGYKATDEEVDAIAADLEDEEAGNAYMTDEEDAFMADDLEDDAMMDDFEEDDAMMADDEFDAFAADDEEDAFMADGDFDEDDAMMGDFEDDDAMMDDYEEEPMMSRRSRRRRKSSRRPRRRQKSYDFTYPLDAGPDLSGYGTVEQQREIARLERQMRRQQRRIKALELMDAPGERTIGIKGVQVTTDVADKKGAYKATFMKYMRIGDAWLTPTEKYVLQSRKTVDPNPADTYKAYDGTPYMKALTTSNAGSVGFGVPDDFIEDLNRNVMVDAEMANDCGTRTTSSDTILQPDLVTTDARRAYPGSANWPGETPTAQSEHQGTDITLGQIQIPIHVMLISTTASYSSLEDVSFDLQATLTEQFSEIVAVEYETLIWSGNGIGKLAGIVNDTRVTNAASTGVSSVSGYLPSGDASSIVTGDAIKNMLMHLPPQYRKSAKWYGNSNTLNTIWELTDGEGNYLWPEMRGMEQGIPTTLLGRPVAYNEFADDIAADAFPLILADLKKAYLIGKRVEFSVRRFDDSKYAELDQALFLGRARIGGQVVKPYAIKALKIATS